MTAEVFSYYKVIKMLSLICSVKFQRLPRPVVGNYRAATRCRFVRSLLPGRIIFQVKCFETFL